MRRRAGFRVDEVAGEGISGLRGPPGCPLTRPHHGALPAAANELGVFCARDFSRTNTAVVVSPCCCCFLNCDLIPLNERLLYY